MQLTLVHQKQLISATPPSLLCQQIEKDIPSLQIQLHGIVDCCCCYQTCDRVALRSSAFYIRDLHVLLVSSPKINVPLHFAARRVEGLGTCTHVASRSLSTSSSFSDSLLLSSHTTPMEADILDPKRGARTLQIARLFGQTKAGNLLHASGYVNATCASNVFV